MSRLGNPLRAALVSLLVISAMAVAGCEEEGPLEKAGESADEAIEETGEKIKEATE